MIKGSIRKTHHVVICIFNGIDHLPGVYDGYRLSALNYIPVKRTLDCF